MGKLEDDKVLAALFTGPLTTTEISKKTGLSLKECVTSISGLITQNKIRNGALDGDIKNWLHVPGQYVAPWEARHEKDCADRDAEIAKRKADSKAAGSGEPK